MKLHYILLLFTLIFSQEWFTEESIDCTVLLEKEVNNHYYPHGTGFFIVNYSGKESSYIVTCEHVLRGSKISIAVQPDSSFVKFMNKKNISEYQFGNYKWIIDNNVIRTKINLIQDSTFYKHPQLDIAIIPINIPSGIVTSGNDSVRVCNVKSFPKSYMRVKKDVKLGEDIYFLGYPYNIGTKEGYSIHSDIGSIPFGKYMTDVTTPVLRTGIVSWKSDTNKEFLLDAFSYSGNSGSPIFTKAKLGKKGPDLIGMVIGHLNEKLEFEDPKNINTSKTKQFGNMGLAICLWVDDILEVVEIAEEKNDN